MKHLVFAGSALLTAAPALAQDIAFTPLAEARLRGEHVEQDGLADDADALTARIRAGAAAKSGKWSALIEGQGNLAIVDRYFDGLHGAATRPLVADPENIALYRAQLQYKSKALTVTAGRQRIALDDERFVGAVAFRQNGQTFDAARVEWSVIPNVKADITYAWGIRTIWGVDGAGARQQAVSGNNFFANLSYASPIGTLTGFGYVVDQDEPAVQGFQLSSTTYGARLAGAQPIGKGIQLSYQASWATQSDHHRNPNRYRARYYLVDAGITVSGFKLSAGYEVLGADKGVAFTSFQTPLATGFKFQGWADKLLTTPADGVRDLYGTIGYDEKAFGPLTGITLQASYHRFESYRLARHYGNEINLLASGKLGKHTTLSLRYASYDADLLATNTRKAWLQFDWAL